MDRIPGADGENDSNHTGRALDPRPEHEMRLAAQVDVPVLTTARSRKQRDLCARFIHAISSCWHGAFVTFPANGAGSSVEAAGGSPDAHRPGDAGSLRRHFELARGGTFFIDDIATLTARAQRQLLCLLEEHVLRDSSTIDLPGVRIIAGASRHLDTERATGAFCEALFYRLNVIHVDLMNHST